MSDRYARQRLLGAVGDAGQQRIAAAAYRPSGARDRSAEVELDYLSRAGARHFTDPDGPCPTFVHAAHFRDPEAQAFAAGAWRALVQLKSALERSPA